MPTIYLVRGAPGSGKSTFARSMVANRKVDSHFESDFLFTDVKGVYRFNPANLSAIHAECQRQVSNALHRGETVVVANTFTRLWEMRPYLNMATERGYTVQVIRCTGTYPNVHEVPEAKVTAMRDRIEDYPGETFYNPENNS